MGCRAGLVRIDLEAGPAGPKPGKGPFSAIGPGLALLAGPLKLWSRLPMS
jgi:hypothetical protein